MADIATLTLLKELLDGWDEEATGHEADAHRDRAYERGTISAERAEQLRQCIEEVSELFPNAGFWHREGVVPPDSAEEELVAVARDAVEEWRAGKLDASMAMHERIWPAVQKLPGGE